MTTEQCLYNIAAALEGIWEELKTMNDTKNDMQFCCLKKHQGTVGQFIKWANRSIEHNNYSNECVGVSKRPAALVLILTGEIVLWDYDDLKFIERPEEWTNL